MLPPVLPLLKNNMYLERRGNKYNSRRTEYHGTSYMSKKEAQKAWELDMLLNAGEIRSWQKQFKLSLDVNGVHITNYFLDFMVEKNDGTFDYIEIKSPATMTDTWKIKWKLAQAIFTDPSITWIVEK